MSNKPTEPTDLHPPTLVVTLAVIREHFDEPVAWFIRRARGNPRRIVTMDPATEGVAV